MPLIKCLVTWAIVREININLSDKVVEFNFHLVPWNANPGFLVYLKISLDLKEYSRRVMRNNDKITRDF